MFSNVTGAEVARHNSRQSCWIVVRGKAYDVTDFLDQHPGGSAVILRLAGRDATEDYESVHNAETIAETLPPAAFQGNVDPSTLLNKATLGMSTIQKEARQHRSLNSIVSVDDFEVAAKEYLTPTGWAYYSSAADDELTNIENRRAFQKITFRPRCLKNVACVDTTTKILGNRTSMPVYISSTGLGKYAHPDAECALARAAGKDGIIQLIPNSPSMSIENIIGARSSSSQTFFQQVYVNRNQEKAEVFIRNVEKLGVKSIWVTVDSPVLGKRERDDRLKAELDETDGESGCQAGAVAKAATAGVLNPSLTWEDLKWIRAATSLPIVLKGIQCVEDAILAYESGVQGIVLSNHGGRSQDTAQAPMVTLLEIRKYAPYIIGRGMEIYVDGGIRRGTDVVKALALGATAVGVGRPCVYSMTANYGEAGVRKLFQILKAELEINMAMVGASSIVDVVPEMVNAMRLERQLVGSASKL